MSAFHTDCLPLPAVPVPPRTRAAAASPAAETVDFETTFRNLYPSLFRYLHRMTGDVDQAEDIAQEAFVRLLGRNLPENEARLWLFTVATNLFRDGARTSRRRERLLAAEPFRPGALPRPDETLDRTRTVNGVRAALEKIPARDRQMLLMREEGFRYDEIARVVQVAPGSVGTLLARATRRFLAVYDAEEEGR